MDLLRGEAGGRHGARQVSICGIAIGHLPGAHLFERCGNVFLFHEVAKTVKGWQHLAGNSFLRGSG